MDAVILKGLMKRNSNNEVMGILNQAEANHRANTTNARIQ